MKFLVRAAFLLALVAAVDGVIFLVLTGNLQAGTYPTDADSLGIPLIESAALSVIAGALMLCCAAASSLSWRCQPGSASGPWRWACASAVALSHLVAAAFFGLWAWSWATPHHYLITAACSLAAAAIIWFAGVDLNRLRPNDSSKPTALRGTA